MRKIIKLYFSIFLFSYNFSYAKEIKVESDKKSDNFAIVLMYHHIGEQNNTFNISLDNFKEEMKFLYDNHYNIISSYDLVSAIQNKRELPKKSVVITFDDGWVSQTKAMEILHNYHYPATFALITQYLNKDYKNYINRFYVEKYKNDNFLYVDHSATHSVKDFLHNSENDVLLSKNEIINFSHSFVPIYIYPYGIHNDKLKNVLKKNGFIAAFGVWNYPVYIKKQDNFNINRYLINDNVDINSFEKIVDGKKLD